MEFIIPFTSAYWSHFLKINAQERPPLSQQLCLLMAMKNTKWKLFFHIANDLEKPNIFSSGKATMIMSTRSKALKTYKTPKHYFKTTTPRDETLSRREGCSAHASSVSLRSWYYIFISQYSVLLKIANVTSELCQSLMPLSQVPRVIVSLLCSARK